ncbi:MAG: hypothetical protein KIT57_15505 [Blastocatellales bacterium]|nr:hypothetical protein [Blastocatellales bacterium]
MNGTGLRIRSLALLSAFILLTAIGGNLPASAQIEFDHLTVDQGLPQNNINAILQTRDGYIWFATNGGLGRFDGAKFRIFNRGNTPQMMHTRLYALYEDREGALWIGGGDGLLMRYRRGSFESFSIRDWPDETDVTRISEDADGYLWLTADRSVIARWRAGESKLYSPKDFLPGRITVSDVRSQHWWSVDDNGVHLLINGRLQTWTLEDGLPTLKIVSVQPDHTGTIWMISEAGLIRITDGDLKVITEEDGMRPKAIHGHYWGARRGDIWITNDSWRLLRGGRLTEFPALAGFGATLYEDREGTLWLGAVNGLARIRESRISNFGLRDGLRSNLIYSIMEDRTGDIWFGSWGGGVFRRHNGTIIQYQSGTHPAMASGRVTSLYEDRAGRIWIATDGGVSRFENGTVERIYGPPELGETWAIWEDGAGNFWFGTTTGLLRYNAGGWRLYTNKDGLPHDRINAIIETRDGALWFGAEEGAAIWRDGRFTAYTPAYGLASGQIRCLYEDSDGALWIGSYDGGLTRFKDGRLTRFTTKAGLYDNGVFRILEDDRGYFWISCNRGIYRVSRALLNDFAEGRVRSVTSTYFGRQDGMLSVECNGGRQPSGWKMRDGRLWFPTMAGAAIIDPAKFPINTLPPGVEIEECQVNQGDVDFSNGLTLEPGQDYLEIDYTGISFIKNEQIRFRYRLHGWDKDWVEAGGRRTAYYNHVAPGEYTFTVLAANSDGVWNTEGRSLRIVVKPPFWRTWWFLTLICLGGGMLGAGAYSRRIMRIRKRQMEQDAFSRQLIESQEHERARFASELHDGLNQNLLVIKNRTLMGEQAAGDPDAVRMQFAEIRETTTQALAESRGIAYDLRPERLDSEGLSATIATMIDRVSASSGISFSTDLADVRDMLAPEAVSSLYRISQECVNNIIHHSEASSAHIRVACDERAVYLTVADNGRGFDPRAVTHSFGLTGIAKRVHLLGGELSIDAAPESGVTIRIAVNRIDAVARQPHTKKDRKKWLKLK